MLINSAASSQAVADAKEWLKVLREKEFLKLTLKEREEVKVMYYRLKEQNDTYQGRIAEVTDLFEELDKILDGQEGFFWKYVKE